MVTEEILKASCTYYYLIISVLIIKKINMETIGVVEGSVR